MPGSSPTPRWPHYERWCHDWTVALKRLNGEFRRDRANEAINGVTVGMCAGMGATLLLLPYFGPDRVDETPWNWLFPLLGCVLLALLIPGYRSFGVRYRFANGEVSEVARNGGVRWSEPLVTLQTVRLPWTHGHAPPVLRLEWPTHHRTLELFPSLAQAVAEVLEPGLPQTPAPPEPSWVCAKCGESNPEPFETCWQCGSAAQPP